jgi:DNA polymerase-3 subunit alpha
MAIADFIHLRTHSAYSLSSGAIKIKDLAGMCKQQAMPAVAVTDSGNLFGALEFSVAAAGAGVQPIIGCELGIRAPAADPGRGIGRPGPGLTPPEPVVLLCQNADGYANLLKLVSKSFLETSGAESPQIALADFDGFSDGLICLTGGTTGPVGRRLLEGNTAGAAAMLLALAGHFPGRLYLELQRHGLADEDRIEAAAIDLAYRHDVPLVATNNVYFADREFYEAHDVLLCIAEGAVLNQSQRRRLTPEHHFKSAAAMRETFADLPEACDNTLAIARRCAYFVRKVKPILPAFPTASGRDEVAEVKWMAHEGLTQRLERQVFPSLAPGDDRAAVEQRYRERLDYELDTIVAMGFPGYFLIVADFIQWAKRNGIPVGPGRGSGAGSVCAWALSITDLDPLPFNLLFERFLNPERVSMPDFDIDFCQERREEVIRYVQEKYGRDRVAQIITFGKLQARAVLRDVGRVLEMPFGQVDRICKLVPNNPANPVTLKQAIDGDPQLQSLRDGDEAVARLMTIGLKLEGLYRHASTHAAGVVIGDRPLDRLVPLYRDPASDMPVTQFNMKYVEDAGLVKFDFLGLKTLTVIDRAVRMIRAQGTEIDLDRIPLDDQASYEMLARGDTVGVFQLEGAGMRDALKKLRPDRFEDIIAVVALYRPGPMENIPAYCDIKHGLQKPDYLHPSLEPVLTETYGIMIYQEQVMQIAQILSGYSLGGADLLRRAMGKKIKAEMDAQRALFVEGAVKNGVDAKLADVIFDHVAKFAGYGFNKSHAAAYALVAYQTAYLKANYPIEFLAASMSLDLTRTDKLNVFRQELVRLGVKLLPPDINRSGVEFAVEATQEGKAVRYALAAVKGVGVHAMTAIVEERERGGPYRDLFEFGERLDTKQFNKRQFENLAKAGAFDSLNRNRAQSFAAAEIVLRHGALAVAEKESNQIGLFGSGGMAAKKPGLPALTEWSPVDRLQQEFEAIGFYLSSHPLDPYALALKRLGVVGSAALAAHVARGEPGRVRLAGIVLSRKERTSAKGSKFAFVQMSDLTGIYEVMIFAETLAQSRALLDSGQPLLVSVDARAEGEDNLRLTGHSFESLSDAAASIVSGLRIEIADPAALPALQRVCAQEQQAGGRGRSKLRLVLPVAGREVELALPGTYALGLRLRSDIQAIPGVTAVQDF